MTLPVGEYAGVESVTKEIIGILQAEMRAAHAADGLTEPDVDIDGLNADTVLLEVGLDSLKVMAVVFKIEAKFDITLDEEDADDLKTVGDLAALTVRRIEENS
jgi:acyl carrier protein